MDRSDRRALGAASNASLQYRRCFMLVPPHGISSRFSGTVCCHSFNASAAVNLLPLVSLCIAYRSAHVLHLPLGIGHFGSRLSLVSPWKAAALFLAVSMFMGAMVLETAVKAHDS